MRAIIACAAILLSAVTASAAWEWQCNAQDQCLWVWTPDPPVYGQVLYIEPDWSQYNHGDIVARHNARVGGADGPLTTDAWYVLECPDGWCPWQSSAVENIPAETPHKFYVLDANRVPQQAGCWPFDHYASLTSFADGSRIERLFIVCANTLETHSCDRQVFCGDGCAAADHPEITPCGM